MDKEKYNVRKWLYKERYWVLLFALVYTLIGEPLLARVIGVKIPYFLTFIFLVLSGVNLAGNKRFRFYVISAIGVTVLIPEFFRIFIYESPEIVVASFFSLFCFFVFMSYELWEQILSIREVDFKSIVAAFSGYFLIGILAFFTYASLELIIPNSFSIHTDLAKVANINEGFSKLFYFAFISLTTIGFGDYVPMTPLAQRFVIFFGLMGQFYLAIVVAIFVGKFLSKDSN